jgi:acetylornithine aminotransferase/acetylornithine/N-succinyldiaminopimelate aminotransferase
MRNDIIIPTPPAEVIAHSVIKADYDRYVVPSYARSVVLTRGEGIYVWDEAGNRYLDFGGGIAVNCLGHAHPAILKALTDQASTLIHCSNLYYHPQQAALAKRLVELTGPGKIFFCNSGAEGNEMLYKLARKYGQSQGRYEVITAVNSFHGRTLGGIAATGQDKIKKGFEPIIPGFVHVPYNDLAAMEAAITDKTAAILIEGIQGEGGITPARPEYLLGLRKLCTERKILLMMDAVQCGMFRTGCFQSYQRILEGVPDGAGFRPDAISMAKSLGGGFPIGAVWMRTEYADLFQPGTHGTTYGGTPLGCAVALAVLETIEKEKLVSNLRTQGERLKAELTAHIGQGRKQIKEVRGFGTLLGVAVNLPPVEATKLLREAGLLVVPAGHDAIRLLPPYNVTTAEVDAALKILKENL